MSGALAIADLDAERALLGELLSRPEQLADAMDLVDPRDFFGAKHRTVYEAILAIDAAGESVDLVSVMRRIRQVGHDSAVSSSDLVELTNAPAIASVTEVARVIKSKSRHRRMLAGLERLAIEGRAQGVDSDAWVERVEQVVFELAASDEPSPTIDFAELIDQSLKTVSDRGTGATDYIPTALATVNRFIHGWEPGLPHIVSARPGLGKTAFALQEIRNVAGRGFGVVMFSLEMPKQKLVIRMLSQEARVDNAKLMTGKLDDADWSAMTGAAHSLIWSQVPGESFRKVQVGEQTYSGNRGSKRAEFGRDSGRRFQCEILIEGELVEEIV
jgi:replicative DNA helicase